jgi:transcriptional regulator of acetoin/glycerol metabolism
MLVSILLQRHLQDRAAQVSFGLQAARTLLLHPWPLNVRQLERTLEVATALADDGRIEASHLSAELLDPPPDDSEPEEPGRPWTEAEQMQRDQLVDILRVSQGNIAAAARDMGKARTQVQRWIKRYRIDVMQFRR